MADELRLVAPPLSEDSEEDKDHHYITLFDNHLDGEGRLIFPRFVFENEGGERSASVSRSQV